MSKKKKTVWVIRSVAWISLTTHTQDSTAAYIVANDFRKYGPYGPIPSKIGTTSTNTSTQQAAGRTPYANANELPLTQLCRLVFYCFVNSEFLYGVRWAIIYRLFWLLLCTHHIRNFGIAGYIIIITTTLISRLELNISFFLVLKKDFRERERKSWVNVREVNGMNLTQFYFSDIRFTFIVVRKRH